MPPNLARTVLLSARAPAGNRDESLEGGWPPLHDFLHDFFEPHVRRFLGEVGQVERSRSPDPEAGDQL